MKRTGSPVSFSIFGFLVSEMEDDTPEQVTLVPLDWLVTMRLRVTIRSYEARPAKGYTIRRPVHAPRPRWSRRRMLELRVKCTKLRFPGFGVLDLGFGSND